MTSYYELMDDRRALNRWHLGSPLDPLGQELDPWQFFLGQPLDLGCVPRFPLQVRGEPLEFCWAAFAIPVLHERCARIFARLAAEEVQLVPAAVEGRSDPYFILNTLRIVRCIDDARCEQVQYWKPEDGVPEKVGKYRDVVGLRIDPAQVGETRVFRTWGWTVALIVSEEIQQALVQEAITGIRPVAA